MNFREAYKHIRAYPSTFWIVIAATLMNQIGNMAVVFLMLYLNHLGYSLVQSSFAFAAFSLSMLLTGLLGGSLIDKLGSARMLTGTLIINGMVLLIFPWVHHYGSIILICLVWGFVYGLYRPASQTFVSQLSSPGIHKLTFSIYRLVLNLGMSIGPAIGGILAGYSYAAIFIVNGIANLLASLILIAGLARTIWFSYKRTTQHKIQLNIRWLKYDSTLRLFVLGMIPISMVFFQHESTLAIYLKESLKFPLTIYGLLFTINTLMIVCFELFLNVATMHWPYRLNFMLGSLFITLGFAGLVFASQLWHVLLLTVFWTIGEMILYPSASSYIADIAPEAHRGSYISMYSTCSNLGMLFGPWGGAMVMQQFGGAGLWIACGVWGLLSVLMFHFLREPTIQHSQAEDKFEALSGLQDAK